MPFDFDDDDHPPVEQLTGPVVAVRGRLLSADFAAPAGPHRFGGALDLDVRGARGMPSGAYGESLWGAGDRELVQVIFEIDPRSRIVVAYNQCG